MVLKRLDHRTDTGPQQDRLQQQTGQRTPCIEISLRKLQTAIKKKIHKYDKNFQEFSGMNRRTSLNIHSEEGTAQQTKGTENT